MNYDMTLARLIPLPIHAALEVALAPVVIAAPFALGLGPAAYVVALVIGVLLMGTGLATTTALSGRAAPQGLRVSAHVDVDLSNIPFGNDFPFGGKRGNRRMTGWL